ncbi:zinc finger CCCH-type with G patch domain-containing protein [Striga asiatica]|uniref:Zinc finger CCCH-type with G patch domain-containing protein n=1 Tax=Striga asiatica TaxID=4170 RepID=A0A5A7PYA4_STRAF|nr:zinc finger CCCH-type with G patch domain-containing protein [Striga asiatica]
MGGKSRKKANKSSSRGSRPRPFASSSSSAGRGLFVEGGFLSDLSAFSSPPSRGRKRNNGVNGNSRSAGSGGLYDSRTGSGSYRGREAQGMRGNAIGYMYPQENFSDGAENQENDFSASNPIVLVDSGKSPIVVYLDEGPVNEPQNMEYTYEYTTSFALDESPHRGLGFHDEMQTPPHGIGSSSNRQQKESDYADISSSEEEGAVDVDDPMNDMSFMEENQGYVVIGGSKIYTQDTSDGDEDEDEDEDVSDDESSSSSDSNNCSETSESDSLSDSGSDVDDEVAEDYFEGIGGNVDTINVNRLIRQVSGVSDDDDDDDEGSLDETVNKLGGIYLQEASRQYGMMPKLGRKYYREDKKSTPVKYASPSAVDDLMFVKDPRTFSRRKKHVARIPQSWPGEARRNKKKRRIPGEKKRHHKEMIAAKRLDRMRLRGVDLQKINTKLEQLVLDGTDMQSFPPMLPRDCSQVRRLAAIYRLQSGCQGSGKKRFVTVIRTPHTSMPSSSDKIRLMIGTADDENADFSVTGGKPLKGNNMHALNKPSTQVGPQSSRKKSNGSSKRKTSGKVSSYAAQPLSFVSSGILNTEIMELKINEPPNETKSPSDGNDSKPETCTVQYGAFEMHTTGFGSKMLAKMGYVEGSGLGKDGQGMAKPIEVAQRPKSLGLGAEAPETSDKSGNVKSQPKPAGRKGPKASATNAKETKDEKNNFGLFEKHTKGFGSRMMAKMGFVEGTGLGKDSQGMVNPLSAVRRPKSMGLGAGR